jgi:hypothetical protein
MGTGCPCALKQQVLASQSCSSSQEVFLPKYRLFSAAISIVCLLQALHKCIVDSSPRSKGKRHTHTHFSVVCCLVLPG